jgi:hypothetical protein
MSAFRFGQRHRRRWSYALATVVAVTLATVFVAARSGAVTGSPSHFESSDGNMTLETSGNTDWNCFVNSDGFAHNGPTPSGCRVTTGATQITADATGETHWVNGQKFDTQCPALTTLNTPAKADFTNVASFNDTSSALDTFFYGATIRSTTNGNASGDVEFNQSAGNGTTSAGCRTPGDRLLAYDFLNGGTSLNFHLLTWIDSSNPNLGGNNGTCLVKTDTLPCWGANIVTVNSSLFDGQSNQSPITAANNGMSNTALTVNQFAEFGINLTQALGLAGQCFAFPQQVWESRSSGSSFTSNPEDIEIEHHPIQNCGEIKIIKQTDPRGQNQDFSFTSSIPSPGTSNPPVPDCTRSPANPSSFTLNDNGNAGKTLGSPLPADNSTGNTQDCTNVIQGTYTVSEGAEPAGFTFASLNCTADAASGSSVTTSSETATITLKPQGLVTCIYVNQLNTATLATQVSNAGPVFPGAAVHDTATVTGNQAADTPSGTVTFFLCGPIPTGSCDGTTNVGMNIGTGTLSGSGATASADSPDVNTSANPLEPGRYCFRATWPGDTNYPGTLTEFGGSNGTNECFTVAKIPTTTKTTPSVGSGKTTTFGSSVTDHAIVQANQTGDGTPTGTVTFFVCNPTQTSGGACPDPNGTPVGSPVTTQAVTGSSPPASSADSSAVMANMTGTWCFRAVYTPGGANGSNYTGSSDATSGECFTVTDTTTATSAQTWLPNDTATVTPANGAPLNGTLSAQLYTGDNCGATSGSAVSGQLYTKTLTNATSAADRTLTTSNATFTVSTSTAVSWLVTFTSTDPNVAPSSHCEVTSLTITN